jgi:acetylornithine deacetylase/succinyl-diaminopimelate desuccinylase family protein
VDAVTRLLSDLVAIPSVNPMGRPLKGPGYFEGEMTDYLERYFGDLGVPFERTPIAPGRDNIVARFESPRGRRVVLFDAHQDTVPTDGMTIAPFVPERIAGRLYGRGSCDVKGGMAAMLTAFARLVRDRPPGSASVLMACTVDEEFTHIGSSYLAAHETRADLAIVAEPTRLDLVNRHKGAIRWKVRTRGVACHSSTPHLGVNAIYRMAEVIRLLQEYAQELAGSTPDPVLGPPSLSVGRIEGGQSVNVVPDWCEIEVDRRIIPGESATDCLTRVREFLTDRTGESKGDWLEFLPPWVSMPALSPGEAGSDEWIGVVQRAIAGAIGRTPEVTGVPYGTDAGPLGAAGLPCLVFGPGDIAQAHTKDEWIELDQVSAAVDAYYQIACALGE